MGAHIISARSVVFLGLGGYGVSMETRVDHGLIIFTLVGLPGAFLREAKDRARSVLQAIECEVLDAHIVVNLSPTGLLKSGSGFDLTIAAAILKAAKAIHPRAFAGMILLAELGLGGGLHPIKGALPAVTATKQIGVKRVIAATTSVVGTSFIADIGVLGFDHLTDVIVWAGGQASKPQLLDPAPMRP